MARRPSLGSHLEWHGQTIRVVVRVPPALVNKVGSTKLKESLKTDSPAAAETLKWAALARLKARIKDARNSSPADPLTGEAFLWKEALADADTSAALHEYEDIARSALEDRAEQIETSLGRDRASEFLAIAHGRATPLDSLLEDWLRERRYTGAVRNRQKRAVDRYLAWAAPRKATAIEAVTRKIAGEYVSHLMAQNVNSVTGNKALSGLAGYWAWLEERGHWEGNNPWRGQRIPKDKVSLRATDGGGTKRPFTDAEVTALLFGIETVAPRGAGRAMLDMCTVAALTGGRIGEIAELRAKHVDLKARTITLPGEKTENAFRTIHLHSNLTALLRERVNARRPEAFVFYELPEQASDARGRAAPVSQAFTRVRRELKVDDVMPGRRQARIDFHGWRRWFIRKAVEALEGGAKGFTAWTIADVVGHSKEDGPLPMTMGRYPGVASMKAMKSCVESVKLPSLEASASAA